MTFDGIAVPLRESLGASLAVFMEFLPKLLGALALLVLGYVLARLLGATVARLLGLLGMDRILARTVVQGVLERAGIRRSASQILGAIAFWVVFLLFIISATETLDLAILSEALTTMAFYLPRVGMAVLIIVLGFIVAGFLRELTLLACNSAQIAQAGLIAQALYIAAILLVIVTAIDQLGIDTTLMNSLLVLLMGGLVAGAALSFGLGARGTVANLIAAHYLRPVLQVGQRVQVGAIRGVIVRLTPTAIILDTDEGRVIVPATHFAETTPIVGGEEERHGA